MLTRAKPKHDILSLRRAAEMSDTIVTALGFGAGLVRIIETDDPDQLRAMLDAAPVGAATQKPAGFVPRGAKRGVLETTFRELHLAAPTPVDIVPLAPGAPFGGVNLNVEGCTLCHACVTACPTGALSDNPDRAMLRFTESLCVQCGLCQSTCPEHVITLEPRLDFKAWNAPLTVLKEEEPFNCIASASRSAPRARSTACSPSSAKSTGCSRAPMPNVSTSSRCARTAESKRW
jgi:ferredoxin